MSMVKVKVLWARMAGFPSWPARYCCAPEEAALTKKKPKSAKVAQSAVVFLGLNTERCAIRPSCLVAWIEDANPNNRFPPSPFLPPRVIEAGSMTTLLKNLPRTLLTSTLMKRAARTKTTVAQSAKLCVYVWLPA